MDEIETTSEGDIKNQDKDRMYRTKPFKDKILATDEYFKYENDILDSRIANDPN